MWPILATLVDDSIGRFLFNLTNRELKFYSQTQTRVSLFDNFIRALNLQNFSIVIEKSWKTTILCMFILRLVKGNETSKMLRERGELETLKIHLWNGKFIGIRDNALLNLCLNFCTVWAFIFSSIESSSYMFISVWQGFSLYANYQI